FQRIPLDRIKGLLPVPRTSAGCTQPGHNGNGSLEFLTCGHGINVPFPVAVMAQRHLDWVHAKQSPNLYFSEAVSYCITNPSFSGLRNLPPLKEYRAWNGVLYCAEPDL